MYLNFLAYRIVNKFSYQFSKSLIGMFARRWIVRGIVLSIGLTHNFPINPRAKNATKFK